MGESAPSAAAISGWLVDVVVLPRESALRHECARVLALVDRLALD